MDYRDLPRVLAHYDWEHEHVESLSWCVGSQSYWDLSQFEESEIRFTEEFDTYCIEYYCGLNQDCVTCKWFKNANIRK